VAHDFNNLLTVIDGYAALLLAELDESRPERREVQHILAAARRAERLTAQLIAFSRDQHIELQLISLNEIVSDLRDMLMRLIPANIQLVVDPSPQPAFVRADRGRVEQVLVNLAVNARDAMPDGGLLSIGTALVDLPAGEAGPKGMRPGHAVMLTVSDTGTGMTAEVRARALEPFYTTKEPGRGTGLGLSTVYGIVQQFGGHLDIYSTVGVGTTVRVLLPQVIDLGSTGGPDAAGPPAPDPAAGRETILLAEDDDAVRELTARMLAGAGYTVLQARDGTEAAGTLACRDDIDMLVTDVIMPGLDGPQLVKRLAEGELRLPVLFTSAYTRGLITHQGLLDPAVAYLEKPFTTAALTQKVRAALDDRRAR
jgi:CheY-like chemotaxis protein